MPRQVKYATGNTKDNIKINVNVYDVVQGLDMFDDIARARIRNTLEDIAQNLERYMKSNHPWSNRTGDAEEGLSAEPYEKGYGKNGKATTLGVKLSHNAVHRGYAYGKSLEYGVNQGPHLARPYPIVEPTVRLQGPVEFMKLRGVLNRP